MESPLDLIKYCHFSFKIFFLIIENPNEGLCAMNTDLVSIITLPPLVQGTLYTCVNTTFPEQYLTVPFELCVAPPPPCHRHFPGQGGQSTYNYHNYGLLAILWGNSLKLPKMTFNGLKWAKYWA